jgi:hypothetical protein
MSPVRRLLLSLAVLAAMTGAACGDPPDKEMQQAQGAIDAARAAGADQYARDEFTAAEDALKRAREAVVQRDYRQALNNALDARERALAASKEAADRKAAARLAAEHALGEANMALNQSRAKLKAAETAHAPAKAISAARRAIDDAEIAVQKARTAFASGDFPVSADAAGSAATHLHAATRDLDAAIPAGVRRRR